MAKARTPGEPPTTPPNGHRPSGKQNQAAAAPPKGSVEKFYAELDRCWEAMEGGDLEEAKRRALKLLRTDGDSPELYVLLGMIASGEGETEQVL